MILIFIFGGLLLLSAFFSGSESALFSIEKSQVDQKVEKRSSLATNWLKYFFNNKEKILSVLLLGNLVVNTAISHTGHRLMENILENYPEIDIDLTSLLFITLTLLIFGEIMPKIIALQINLTWSYWSAPVLKLWYVVLSKIAMPVFYLTEWISRRFSFSSPSLNELDLIEAVKEAKFMGILKEDEKQILQRSIHFYYDDAYSIMIPKKEINMIPSDSSFRKAGKLFALNKNPIAIAYNKNGEIPGYVHVRSIISGIHNSPASSIKNKIEDMIYLPETISIRDVLEKFLTTRCEVAAIVDELGELSGIITMKDIFEKLMGEVNEEYQKNEITAHPIVKIKEGTFKIDGSIPIHEFNEYFKLNLESESSETLSGYLIENLDGYPHEDTELQSGELKFYKMKIEENKISELYLDYNGK